MDESGCKLSSIIAQRLHSFSYFSATSIAESKLSPMLANVTFEKLGWALQ